MGYSSSVKYVSNSLFLLLLMSACVSQRVPDQQLPNSPDSLTLDPRFTNEEQPQATLLQYRSALTRSKTIKKTSVRAMMLSPSYLRHEIRTALKMEALKYGLDDDQLKYSIQWNLNRKQEKGFCFLLEVQSEVRETLDETKWNFSLLSLDSKVLSTSIYPTTLSAVSRTSAGFLRGELCTPKRPKNLSGLQLGATFASSTETMIFALFWK
jgi:hypothetical protein